MNDFIARVKGSLKEHGLFVLIIYRIDVFLEQFFSGNVRLIHYYFFAQPITNKCTVKHADKRKIKTYMAEVGDDIFDQCPRPKAIIESRFNQNSKCFVATKEREFVGYIWFSEDKYIEDEVRCVVVPEPKGTSAWDYDVYVNPANRLSLAFPMLWDQVNLYLSDKGYKWTISRISPINSVSLSTHKKLGAIYIGQAVFFCLWKLQFMFSSIFPYIHVSRKTCPTLNLEVPNSLVKSTK